MLRVNGEDCTVCSLGTRRVPALQKQPAAQVEVELCTLRVDGDGSPYGGLGAVNVVSIAQDDA